MGLELLEECLEALRVGDFTEGLELCHVGDLVSKEGLVKDWMFEHIIQDQASYEVVIEIYRLVKNAFFLDVFLIQGCRFLLIIVEKFGLAFRLLDMWFGQICGHVDQLVKAHRKSFRAVRSLHLRA